MRDVRMSRKVRAQSVRFLTLWALRCEQDVCMWGGRLPDLVAEEDCGPWEPLLGLPGCSWCLWHCS